MISPLPVQLDMKKIETVRVACCQLCVSLCIYHKIDLCIYEVYLSLSK